MKEEKKKNLFLSKTLWVNAILAGVAFFPSVQAAVKPEMMMLGMSVINMVLRMVTKQKLGLIE